MLNPIKDFKDWFNSGLKFGYNTIKVGFNLALVYAIMWTFSQIGSCKKQNNKDYNTLENKFEMNTYYQKNVYFKSNLSKQDEIKDITKRKNLEDYIINFYN
jgi:hypothetical protein